MTDNHLLLYRLAELMLKHEQHILPVDLLFDDEQIGDFVKSIQIDSPYQQLLLNGVCTESIREEALNVSFTTEGYFHFLLGEVLYTHAKHKEVAFLLEVLKKTNLIGLERGVSNALYNQVLRQEFDSLALFIQSNDFKTSILCVEPIIAAFFLFGTTSCLQLWFSQINDCNARLLDAVRKRLVYSGKKVILSQFDSHLWEAIRALTNPSLSHLFVLSPQLANRKLPEIEAYYVSYQNTCKLQKSAESLTYQITILENLGESFLKYSSKKIALSCYEQAMELAQTSSKKLYLKSLIAQIYKSLSNTVLAVNYYQEVIKESNSINLWTIESVTKLRLGEIYKQQNLFSEAGALFTEVVGRYRKRMGNYHVQTAKALGYLGSFHIYLKEWKVAKVYIEESMEIRMKLLGEFNTKTCISYVNYAEILMELGDFEMSKYYLEKALTIRCNKFGRTHQDVAYTLVRLGYLALKNGEVLKAKKIQEEALEIRIHKLGNEHNFTQESRLILLHIHGQSKELEEFLKIKEAYLSQAGNNLKNQQELDQIQSGYFK